MGHNRNHYNKEHGMLLSWSTDELDCPCGKSADHKDDCAPKDPSPEELVVQTVG